MDIVLIKKGTGAVGYLQDFELDADINGEKNFVLKIKKSELFPEFSDFWAVPNTEYGGIVDSIAINSDGNYECKGRTIRGILDGILMPIEIDKIAWLTNGDNIISLQKIAERIGAQTKGRAESVLSCINACLEEHERLSIKYLLNDKFEAEIISSEDFSEEVKFSPDLQYFLAAEKRKNNVKKLLCTDGVRRIALYITDDYRLDGESYNFDLLKYKFDIKPNFEQDTKENNITKIIEVEPSDPISKCRHLKVEPSDWSSNEGAYYEVDEGKSFEPAKGEDKYTPLSSKPSDWSSNYGAYFTIDSQTGEYSNVQGETVDRQHILLKRRPPDWSYNYSNYYKRRFDGYTYVYEQVDAPHKNYYRRQTRKPTDWEVNFSSYYYLKKGQFLRVEKVVTKKKKWYKTSKNKWKFRWVQEYKTPPWRRNKYYTQYQKDLVPTFKKNKYYRITTREQAPVWSSGIYKRAVVAPNFRDKIYYKKRLDYYQKLVEAGINFVDSLKSEYRYELRADELQLNIGDWAALDDVVNEQIINVTVSNIILKATDAGANFEIIAEG